jgi:hypothetical protein
MIEKPPISVTAIYTGVSPQPGLGDLLARTFSNFELNQFNPYYDNVFIFILCFLTKFNISLAF